MTQYDQKEFSALGPWLSAQRPLSTAQAACYLGVSKRTLQTWRGELYGPRFRYRSARSVVYPLLDAPGDSPGQGECAGLPLITDFLPGGIGNYMFTDEAAKMLGKTTRTLESWRLAGVGPAFRRIGDKVVYAREDVVSFVRIEAVVLSE